MNRLMLFLSIYSIPLFHSSIKIHPSFCPPQTWRTIHPIHRHQPFLHAVHPDAVQADRLSDNHTLAPITLFKDFIGYILNDILFSMVSSVIILKAPNSQYIQGTPCDRLGNDLEDGASPPSSSNKNPNDYSPFANRAEFELAEFLFTQEGMSAGKIDRLLNLLSSFYNQPPPFASHKEMYALIDSIKQGDVPWNSFSVSYDGDHPKNGPVPLWMEQKYEVWFRDPLLVLENQIGNPDFKNEIDYSPKRVFKNGVRRFRDLMSGNWCWNQCVCYTL